MKRLIPAAVILVFTISICIFAHIYVDRKCEQTLKDIEAYCNHQITASELENFWQKRKEQMSLFVNHGFLDKISIYIGQLSVRQSTNIEDSDSILKNIQTILTLIKEEQQFALHSFY